MQKEWLLLIIVLPIGLFGQIREDFQDNNLNQAPAWQGDTAYFEHTQKEQLQLKAGNRSSPAKLFTATQSLDSLEWQFWVRLDFSPSNSNQLKLILGANDTTWSSGYQGYYLRIGENGSQDGIDLYRQDNTQEQKIMDGTAGFVAKGTQAMRIKVKRQKKGQWTIWADSNGKRNFIKQGSTQDNTYSPFSYLGLQCEFTSTRSDKFFFDDIYRGLPLQDTTPPKPLNFTVKGNDQLAIRWSEPVLKSSLQNAKINLKPGNQSTSARTFQKGLPSETLLTFSAPFQNKNAYDLIIENLKDKEGNTLNDTLSFNYVRPDEGDILINELFPDPTGSPGLPEHEFVEVYNKTDFPLNLNGWYIADQANRDLIHADSLLRSGERAIVTSQANEADFQPYGQVFTVSSLPSLNNGGDRISLLDGQSDTIDKVSYTDDWYDNPQKAAGGWTLEQINVESPCKGAINWRASKNPNGGTPGDPNSIAKRGKDTIAPSLTSLSIIDSNTMTVKLSEKGDFDLVDSFARYFTLLPANSIKNGEIVNKDSIILSFQQAFQSGVDHTLIHKGIPDCWQNTLSSPDTIDFTYYSPYGANYRDVTFNEIMAAPSPSQGLPEAEFVEIRNTSNQTFSLQNWTFSDPVTSGSFPDSILKPNELAILCPESAANQFQSYGPVIPVDDFPTLNNGGDHIRLTNPYGEILDSLNYQEEWYANNIKQDGGWSLERINPNHPCGNADNWIGSKNEEGGTPGKQNSQFDPTPDTTAPAIQAVKAIDTTTILVQFDERIKTASIELQAWTLAPSINFDTIDPGRSITNSIKLKLNSPLEDQTGYTLTIQSIADCWGNTLSGSISQSFEYLAPKPSDKHDLLITEIMADPNPPVKLPNYEYIELKNTSDKVLAIQEHLLIINENENPLPDKLIKPDSFVTLTKKAGGSAFEPQQKPIGVSGLSALPNSGGVLSLRNRDNNLIHAVQYRSAWYGESYKQKGGWSLAMKDLSNPCSGASNWGASQANQGGTPGKPNALKESEPDTSAPQVSEVLVLDSNRIAVIFNERMDSLALTKGNYRLEPDIPIANIESPAPLFRKAQLTLAKPLQASTLYTLRLSDIQDCSGNSLNKQATLQVGLPKKPEEGDLLINEILFDPHPGGSDFVEIFNTSDRVIDLEPLQMAKRDDSGSLDQLEPMPNWQLLPGDYAVITEQPPYVKQRFFVKNPSHLLTINNMPTYPNETGHVVLANRSGEVLDEVHYRSDWHAALVDDPEGVSLERISHEAPSNDKANWHSAAETEQFGTPTYENSQAGEVKEADQPFSLKHKRFSPDQDGYKDFLMIQYDMKKPGFLANITIYDTKGRLVTELTNNHLMGKEGRIKWDGTRKSGQKATKGVYILHIEAFHPDGDKVTQKLSVTLGGQFK